MSQKTCKTTVLYSNDFGHVARCCCGTAHIHLGPMTLRVPESKLGEVAELLIGATRKIVQANEGPSVDDSDVVH